MISATATRPGTKMMRDSRRCAGVVFRCRYGSPNMSVLTSYPSGMSFLESTANSIAQ